MARYRTIVPELWEDAWFADLSARAQLFWIYLLTNRSTEPSGIYRLNWRATEAILRCSSPWLQAQKEAFGGDGKAVFYGEWVFVRRYVQYQPPKNPNTWLRIIDQLGHCPKTLLTAWLEQNRLFVPKQLRNSLPTVKEPLGNNLYSDSDSDSERERERESDKKKERKKARNDSDESSSPGVPPDLKGLELYEIDEKLCKAWPSFKVACEQAYPAVDIVAETRKAHVWEVARPKNRKKDRPRYLRNWFASEQDKWHKPEEGGELGHL